MHVLHLSRRVLLLLLLSYLSFSLWSCSEPPVEKKVRGSSTTKVLDPGKEGPYAVGVTTLRLVDAKRVESKTKKARPMVIEIWYPAVDAAKKEKKDVYEPLQEAPGETRKKLEKLGVMFPSLPQNAYRDVPSFKEDGAFPVILFSHGSGGIRFQSIYLCAHLASHGYIVISVDHEGNTMYNLIDKKGQDRAQLMQSAIDRPIDLKFMLSLLEKKNKKKDDLLYGLVNLEMIGVTGHSFGGLTSVLAARHIKNLKVSVPQTPMTSLAPILGVESDDLSELPFMVMGSKGDDTLDYQKEQRKFYDLLKTKLYNKADRYLMAFEKGGHFTYSDLCSFDLARYSKKLGIGNVEKVLNDGCHKEKNTKIKLAHGHIRYYATAMFNLYLRGSKGTQKYLKNIDEKEIEFEASLKSNK